MIVACPKCKARYKVDDAKIGDAGIKLRCSKCQTVFKVMKKAETPPAPEPVQTTAPPPPPPPISQPAPQAAPPPPPISQPAPQAAPIPPPIPQPVTPEPTPAPAPSPFAGTEILVATENDDVLSQIGGVLAEARFSAVTSRDGIEALDIIKTRNPKVAILDVILPKLLGFELCELIKNHDELKSIHVILLAAQNRSERYKRSPENLYGADGYLEIKDIPEETVGMIND